MGIGGKEWSGGCASVPPYGRHHSAGHSFYLGYSVGSMLNSHGITCNRQEAHNLAIDYKPSNDLSNKNEIHSSQNFTTASLQAGIVKQLNFSDKPLLS